MSIRKDLSHTPIPTKIYLSIIVPSFPFVLEEDTSTQVWSLFLFFRSYLLSITQGLYTINYFFSFLHHQLLNWIFQHHVNILKFLPS